MTEYDKLTRVIPPPTSPVVGNLDRAQAIVEDYTLQFPDEFWQIAAAYGQGSYHDEPTMTLLHPCAPNFVGDLLARTNELRAVVKGYDPSYGNNWIPLINVFEWAFFSPAGSHPDGEFLFACLGGEGFHLLDFGLAKFIRVYPTVVDPMVFGDESTPLPAKFVPATNFYYSNLHEVKSQAEDSEMNYAVELFGRLRECWPVQAER